MRSGARGHTNLYKPPHTHPCSYWTNTKCRGPIRTRRPVFGSCSRPRPAWPHWSTPQGAEQESHTYFCSSPYGPVRPSSIRLPCLTRSLTTSARYHSGEAIQDDGIYICSASKAELGFSETLKLPVSTKPEVQLAGKAKQNLS
jgi:hypothetical protein